MMEADRIKMYRTGWRAIARRFLLLFVPLYLLAGFIVAAIYGVQFRAARVVLQMEQKNHVAKKSDMVVSDFPQIVSDLLILSESRTLQSLLAGDPRAGEALAQKLVVFTQHKRNYDQVRYLDGTGRKVIRINFRQGQSVIVPEQQLQAKTGRYYFPETIRVSAAKCLYRLST